MSKHRRKTGKTQVEKKVSVLLMVFNCLKIILSDRMDIAIDLRLDRCVSGLLNGHKHFVKFCVGWLLN